MNSKLIFKQMKELWAQFETEHNEASKLSNIKARNTISLLKSLITDYKKYSMEEDKN